MRGLVQVTLPVHLQAQTTTTMCVPAGPVEVGHGPWVLITPLNCSSMLQWSACSLVGANGGEALPSFWKW